MSQAKALSVILLLLCIFGLQAQSPNTIEELEQELRLATADSAKFRLHTSLSKYYSSVDVQVALEHNYAVCSLAAKQNRNDWMAVGYANLGALMLEIGKLDSSEYFYNKILADPNLPETLSVYPKAYNGLARVADSKAESDKALQLYFKALEWAQLHSKDSSLAFYYYDIGMSYQRRSDFSKSLEYLHKAIEQDNAHSPSDLDFDYFAVSNVEIILKQYEAAKFSLRKAEKASQIDNDHYMQVFIYGNFVRVSLRMDQLDSAQIFYEKLLQASQQIKVPYTTAIEKDCHAQLAYAQGDYALAQTLFRSVLALYEELQTEDDIQETRMNLARTLIKMGKHAEGTAILPAVIDYFAKSKSYEVLVRACAGLSEGYEKMGQYQKALNAHKLLLQYEDSLLIQESNMSLSNMRLKFENEQKVIRLEKEQEKARYKALWEARRLEIGIAVLMFVILISVTAFLVNRGQMTLRFSKALEEKNAFISKQNESLEKANKDLRLFAQAAAHDLKEPLRTMGAFASLLKRRYPPEHRTDEAVQHMEFITRAAGKMSVLLDDLQRYSLLHGPPSMKETVALSSLFDGLRDDLAEIIAAKNIQLNVQTPHHIFGDPALFYRLFLNLMTNASKFNDKPNPAIFIWSEKTADGNIRIALRDNGIGIPSDQLNKIFDLLKRLAGQFEGSGVGLALAKKIVDMHDGRIWVESEENQGSTFYVELPEGPGEENPRDDAPTAD